AGTVTGSPAWAASQALSSGTSGGWPSSSGTLSVSTTLPAGAGAWVRAGPGRRPGPGGSPLGQPQDVADAADGVDEPRLDHVDLAAQVRHVRLDDAGVPGEVVVLEGV